MQIQNRCVALQVDGHFDEANLDELRLQELKDLEFRYAQEDLRQTQDAEMKELEAAVNTAYHNFN